MTPWLIRPYGRPLDADFCVAAFIRSWARSRHGRAMGAHVDHSPERQAFWRDHEAHVHRVLAEDTRVLHKHDNPDVIFAFACLGDGAVHYVLAKTSAHDDGLAGDMLRALLADRLAMPQVMTHELRELRRAGIEPPASWREDFYYFARRRAA